MSYKKKEELAQEATELWNDLKNKKLSPKDRLAIPVQEMPTRNPTERAHQMSEVALGYTEEQARVEAERCLSCKNRP